MTTELSKAERERLIDEKIKRMKAKNALAEQRKREVDKDRAIAENNKSSITVAPKPKYETESVTASERPLRTVAATTSATGAKSRRNQPEETLYERAPPATSRARNLVPDPDGPPPDPGYRFLADRMRDEDQGDASNKNSRDNLRPGNRNSRGGGKARERIFNNKERLQKDEEDDVILVSESDKRGNVITYQGESPSKHDDRRGGNKRVDLRGNNSNNGLSGLSPNSKLHQPTKIKSLFDDDDDEYYFPERWKGKEHHPKLFDSQRKIEHTPGGKLMVTRTIDPVARLESEHTNPQQNRIQDHNEFMNRLEDEKVSSNVEWQCSDPACRNLNPPGTFNCARCKLAFSKSNEYKNNLACDKYKQEFRRGPVGLPTLQPPPNLGQQQLTGTAQGYGTVNGLVDSHSLPQFYPSDVSGGWQGQDFTAMTAATADWNSISTADNPGIDAAASTASWPAAVQQDIMLTQNFGMIHQMPVAGFTSSNYYDQHSQAPPSNIAPNVSQYYPQQAEYVTTPFLDHAATSQFPRFPQQTANQFNPIAQAFVPTTSSNEHKKINVPTSLYQTPPPLLPVSILNRPPPPSNKSSDPNLLVSLNSPPKPLRINRLDPRKHIRSRNSEEVLPSINSRLSDKNTQKIPPRFSKARELNHNFKPPSLLEMQSGSLKRGNLPPPPADKGNGLLIFGTSNVMNNLDATKFSSFIRIPVRLVAAMKLELFQTAVVDVDPSRDWLVLIHGLGNDARNIALKQKSEQAKAKEADEIANTFCDSIEHDILTASAHIRVLISLLLPRFDFEEKSGLSNPNNVRKVINVAITERFYLNPRVELINSDHCLLIDNEESRQQIMGSDGYHLTHEGFKNMVGNWMEYLNKIIREAAPRQVRSTGQPIYSSEPPTEYLPKFESNTVDEPVANPLLITEEGTESSPNLAKCEGVSSDETVPDPFGTYTAPVTFVSPTSRKEADDEIVTIGETSVPIPNSDTESNGEGSIPSLETVDPPAVPSNSQLSESSEDQRDVLTSYVDDALANPLMESDTIEQSVTNKLSNNLHPTEKEEETSPDKEVEKKDETFIKPNFKLGSEADVNGEYIDDEYVNGGVITMDPLPSMIQCSGPQSNDFGPVSGIFFEDSYLPTNLDSLNMEEDTSILQVPCENETNTTTNTATTLIDSEESDNLSSKKLQGNGSENLIET